MISHKFLPFLSWALLILPIREALADGYYYNRPSVAPIISAPSSGGHYFAPLPTVLPLPPVPPLPPLPTPRPPSAQVHPQVPKATYIPAAPAVSKVAQAYQGPSAKIVKPQIVPAFPQHLATPSAPTAPAAPSAPSIPSAPSVPAAPIIPASPPQALPQPLRIPFGKQAVIRYPNTGAAPDGEVYFANGRQLKQYAVIEIIDNDIEPQSEPFLSSPFFESVRARTSTPSAAPTAPGVRGIQLDSRASTTVREQQQLASQSVAPGDAVALGSGGLGYIRSNNGNVYLGSGSLAYISGQEHSRSLTEARTRSGAPRPDPLHFGHGPIGFLNDKQRVLRFK